MRRPGLDRRLRALEGRRSVRWRAAELLENFEAELALLSNDELIQRILALQDDPNAYTKFDTAYQFFDDALVATLTDEEFKWVVAELEARNAECVASQTTGGELTGN